MSFARIEALLFALLAASLVTAGVFVTIVEWKMVWISPPLRHPVLFWTAIRVLTAGVCGAGLAVAIVLLIKARYHRLAVLIVIFASPLAANALVILSGLSVPRTIRALDEHVALLLLAWIAAAVLLGFGAAVVVPFGRRFRSLHGLLISLICAGSLYALLYLKLPPTKAPLPVGLLLLLVPLFMVGSFVFLKLQKAEASQMIPPGEGED